MVLPVFLLILSGIFDFGNMLYTRMTVINATREGARAAAVSGDTPANIPSIATGASQGAAPGMGSNLGVATSCLTPGGAGEACSAAKSGDSVSVTGSYTYHTFFPLLFGSTFSLKSTVQMVLE